jgi:hypothetical protein
MTSSDSSDDRKADPRKERLAAQLRANLQKRKTQARSRRSGEPDSRREGLLDKAGKPSGGAG